MSEFGTKAGNHRLVNFCLHLREGGEKVKQEYVAPTVEDLGSLPELTLGQAQGMRLDADFDAGTLFGDLTFS